jgi:hypothetical protein
MRNGRSLHLVREPQLSHAAVALEHERPSVAQVLVIGVDRRWQRASSGEVVVDEVALHEEADPLPVLCEQVLEQPKLNVADEVAKQFEEVLVPHQRRSQRVHRLLDDPQMGEPDALHR